MAAGCVQRGRGGAAAGDRGDPRRLHRRRGRSRQRLRPARRKRRRLLPGRRGRRRDHRRSRHAAAARLSDPAGRAARADLYRPADGRRRRRRATAWSTGSTPTATPPSPPGWRSPGPSPPSRRSPSPAPRAASTTAAAARSRRACATSPCGTPPPWSAPTSARRSGRGWARPSRNSGRWRTSACRPDTSTQADEHGDKALAGLERFERLAQYRARRSGFGSRRHGVARSGGGR